MKLTKNLYEITNNNMLLNEKYIIIKKENLASFLNSIAYNLKVDNVPSFYLENKQRFKHYINNNSEIKIDFINFENKQYLKIY